MGQIFRPRDILYGVRKHLSVVIAATVCGLVLGAMIFVVQYFSASDLVGYTIYASFSVSTINADGNFTNGTASPSQGDFELADEMMPAVMYVCHSETVCGEVIDRLNLVGVSIHSLQSALSMSQTDETSVMSITLSWDDEEEGIEILSTFLDVLPSAMQEVFTIGTINVIEQPIATMITTTVSKSVIILLTGVGFLIGMLYCFSQLYLHPTLIEVKDVGELFELNLLSEIPDSADYPNFLTENLITNRADLPAGFRENYTALSHILLHQMEEEHFCLFVTSAARGEGKTTVVANLGMELAALDKRVLLIDFDLTSPTLGSCFLDKIDYRNTVNAVYFDETSVQNAIIHINERLHILPACLDKRHIGINRFAKKLVAQMEEQYDVILLDTEPVGESSEMLYFSNVSNSALFIIRYDYTPCDEIENSVEKLRKTNTVIQGAVVNRVVHFGFGRLNADDTDGDETKSAGILSRIRKPKNNGKAEKKGKHTGAAVSETSAYDDSDLVDDPFLTELLAGLNSKNSQTGTGKTERHNSSMSQDDELDEMESRDFDDRLFLADDAFDTEEGEEAVSLKTQNPSSGKSQNRKNASDKRQKKQTGKKKQSRRSSSKTQKLDLNEIMRELEDDSYLQEIRSARQNGSGSIQTAGRITGSSSETEQTFSDKDPVRNMQNRKDVLPHAASRDDLSDSYQLLQDLDDFSEEPDMSDREKERNRSAKLTYNDWDGDDF